MSQLDATVVDRLRDAAVQCERGIETGERFRVTLEQCECHAAMKVSREIIGGERERAIEARQRLAVALQREKHQAPLVMELDVAGSDGEGLVVARKRLDRTAERPQHIAAVRERRRMPRLQG